MKSYEYRMHRRAGLLAARKYRARIGEAQRGIQLATPLGEAHVAVWQRNLEDWHRRLRLEQMLLAVLRAPTGVHGWRLAVIEFHEQATGRMLGVDSRPDLSYGSERQQ